MAALSEELKANVASNDEWQQLAEKGDTAADADADALASVEA